MRASSPTSLADKEDFDVNHVYDLDGDGLLCAHDITLYTELIDNYDNPIVPSTVRQ